MNKLIIITLVLIFNKLIGFSQTDNPQNISIKGIRFVEGLSWEQIIAKAKNEKKYIFIDCYATWCRPCKWMDSNIYAVEKIGSFMNANFICVKAQMDTSKSDNQRIQNWYPIAQSMRREYDIKIFPTYLFYSFDGKPAHKDIGAKNLSDFLRMTESALNPDQQFYTLLNSYLVGKKDYSKMPYLASAATRFGDKSLAIAIASDYINNFLEALEDKELYSKDKIKFICTYYSLITSKHKVFDLFYRNGKKVDEIMDVKGLSDNIVDNIITKEVITPVVNAVKGENEPDWKKCFNDIKVKYGNTYADRNVLTEKVKWYNYNKKWENYTKNLIHKIEKYGVGNSLVDALLNDNAFEIFMYSNNKQELKKALAWVKRAIRISSHPQANYLDTYANLLYKLGRIKEAKIQEEQAAKLSPNDKQIQMALEDMKQGKPTYYNDGAVWSSLSIPENVKIK